MRNNGIPPWDPEQEERSEFVRRIIENHHPYYSRGSGSRKFPAFAPLCALEHLSLGETIPVDWPHVLHMIYKIRCNLFHGGKNYDSSCDRRFITLAYTILWEMWQPELPFVISKSSRDITWERAFVRSGFLFQKAPHGFDFSAENEGNRRFLRKLLEEIHLAEYLVGDLFAPPTETVSEGVWLGAIEKLHTGAEAGPAGLRNIELEIMDTYMAGVVRWINAIGINTIRSCDGHGIRLPWLDLENEGLWIILDACLAVVSRGRWRFRGPRSLVRADWVTRPGRRVELDRSPLLDLAEALFTQRAALTHLVEQMKKIMAAAAPVFAGEN